MAICTIPCKNASTTAHTDGRICGGVSAAENKKEDMINHLLYKLYWRLTVNEWQIGFPQTTRENIATGSNYKIALLKGVPNDRWFADPFVLDVTPTHIILLVEEFVKATAKGRIARLTVSRNDYTLERNDTLLDLDTHLSFPTIVRQGDAVYVIPENSAGGKLNAYLYDEAAAKCVPSPPHYATNR